MAKAKQCPLCGVWYNPKFTGNPQMCLGCIISSKMKETDTPPKQ